MTPHAKFYLNLTNGASRQRGEIYTKIFLVVHIPFSETHLQFKPFSEFLRAMAQTTQSRARMCLLGVKKVKINI